MAKPYRVKRGGKFIGSFLHPWQGKRINLRTKDANEARTRGRLVERGLWPPAEDAGAARAVKAALEGSEELASPASVTPQGDVSTEGTAAPEGAGAAVPVTPSPEPATPQPEPAPTPAEAVNSAAAADDEEIEAEATAALKDAGIDLNEIGPMLPEKLGRGFFWVTGQISKLPTKWIAGRHAGLQKLPEEMAPIYRVTGKCVLRELAKLGIDLERLTPRQVLILFACVGFAMQTGMGIAAVAEQAAQSESEQPKQPAAA